MINFKIISKVFLLLVFIILLPGVSCKPPGKKAPDFKLKQLDGKPLRLSNLKGKAVLINFWATYCPPCVKEIPMFQALYNEYKKQDFIIIGISIDRTAEIASRFIKKMGVTYPIVMATKKTVKEYKVRGLPTTFLVNRSGEIIQQYIGLLTESMLRKDIQRALGS